MISVDMIKNFFPTPLANNPQYLKLMLKEYVQCQLLEYLSYSNYISKRKRKIVWSVA